MLCVSKYKCLFLVLIAVVFLFGGRALCQTMSVGGTNWSVPVIPITEAGSNYGNGGIVESAVNQIKLSISVPLLLGQGKVSVHYQPNGSWPNNLQLSVKRTGEGSLTSICALCSVSGGINYLTLRQSDQSFFSISAVLNLASYTDIPIQVKISGLSVTIPADSYSSNIVFTISPN